MTSFKDKMKAAYEVFSDKESLKTAEIENKILTAIEKGESSVTIYDILSIPVKNSLQANGIILTYCPAQFHNDESYYILTWKLE